MDAIPSWLASGHDDTPLILLHGLGLTAETWLPQLHHFGRTRQTIAWTQPGFSPSPALQTLSWEGLASSLASMLNTLNIDKAHILGHSMGGMVAQEFYHRYPQRVKSLILYSTSSAFGSSDPQWKEDFVRDRKEDVEPFANFTEAAPTLLSAFIGPAITPIMRQFANIASRDVSIAGYLETMKLLVTFNRKAELGTIAVPTLLLAGEHDTQAPPKGMKRMVEQIPGAQYVEFAGAQHMANLEATAMFNRVVEDFLSSLPDRAGR
jgi:pimeloyl-ACP methyl ester carboxylesterase